MCDNDAYIVGVPRHYNLVCNSCRKDVWCSEATTWIELEDGTEKIVGHPGEVRRIEQWSGRSFHDVLDADRLHYSRLLVCGTCGSVDHYRDDEYPALRRPARYRTADELEEDRRRSQDELRGQNPEVAQKSEEKKIGPFLEYKRTPDRDEFGTKTYRQYKRLLGQIDEDELAAVACKACDANELRIFGAFASQAREEAFAFVCPHCGERTATLSDRMRIS